MSHSPTLATWQALRDDSAGDLLAAVDAFDDPTHPGAVARLRKRWPPELTAAAVHLILARRKAAVKFDHHDHLMADPVGVEQATGLEVARHKARRYQEAGIHRIIDLCCGIGGDAMALSEHAEMILIDVDPIRVWMARHNSAVINGHVPTAVAGDVTTLNLRGMPFHIDPARRTTDGRRRHRFEDGIPGGAYIRSLIDQSGDGAVKLGPGVDLENLPPGEVEIIASRGSLVQAVLWTGRLAHDDGQRTATRLPDGLSFSGAPDLPIPISDSRKYLLAVDPAVERAGLLGALGRQLDLPAIHPALGLLTADVCPDTPWLTPYTVLDTMPWHEKKVRAWLKANDAGEVIVKTRDRTVDPDVLSKRFRGVGTGRFTLFILRMDKKVRVWITQRETICVT